MTGKPPFDGESPVAVAIQHINGKAAAPSTLNPNIPGGLEQIIMRAMEQNPAKRYTSASKMLFDMDEFRKDPTILFDYNNPETDVDASTRLKHKPQEGQETPTPQPKKPAERPSGEPPVRRPRRAPQNGQQGRKPARRPKEEIVEEEPERSSKVATIAIVFCAVVAVIAIVVCIFAITNSASSNMISVPSLVGMTEEQALALPDLVIKVGDRKTSSKYPAGQIISQSPTAGSQIAKGGQITIVVSLGMDVKTGIMADLTNTLEADAINYLNGQGLGLQIIPKRENSGTIAAGHIIRTEPAVNQTLYTGQTVYLYISTGPDIKMANVPNVKGLDYELARGQLNSRGFFNIDVVMVESDQEKNTVVDISVTEGESMDVNTQIVLYLSNGKGGAIDPTEPTDPSTPPLYDPNLVSTVVTIDLPEGMPQDYVLSVWQGNTLVEEIQLPRDAISRDIELTGKGTMSFEIRVGDLVLQSITIDFEQYRVEEPTEPEVVPSEPENGNENNGNEFNGNRGRDGR